MVMSRLGKEDGCVDPKYCISIESEEGEKNNFDSAGTCGTSAGRSESTIRARAE